MATNPPYIFAESVPTQLLRGRIIVIGGVVDDALANEVVGELLVLEGQSAVMPITIYINSPGGWISAGLAIYDTMQLVKPDIVTVAMGRASSIAALLLAAGARGKRHALPNSRVLIHQPEMRGLSGQASDIEIHARDILRTRGRLNELFAKHTGQPIERIERDCERDHILSASEAKDYGLVDWIIGGTAEGET